MAGRGAERGGPPQDHHSSGGNRARYGGDVKLVGANQWSALDGKHVEFIFDTVRNPKRSYTISIQDLLKTYETYDYTNKKWKQCTFIEKMHHCSIAARKQMKRMLQRGGWYKHGGHWCQ